jgi:hypothetical protein
MLSPKAYWKFVVGALVLPSYLGFESATASVKDKVNVLSSRELAPFVQRQANLSLDKSSQIAENEEFETDKLKSDCHCHRPYSVHYYKIYNPSRGHGHGHGQDDEHEEHGHGHDDEHEEHGRGHGHRYRRDDEHEEHGRGQDEHESNGRDYEHYEHEVTHFGHHQKRHGRHCI